MLPTVPVCLTLAEEEEEMALKEVARHPQLFAVPAGPAGAEHLLLQRNASSARLLLEICTYRFESVYIWSQNVCRLDDSLLPPRLWTKTTWPALLGWSSGLAGATLNDRPACFARRARGPSRFHADRQPDLLLSSGLMALRTSQPGLVCSAAPLAQSSPKHTHSPIQSFTH